MNVEPARFFRSRPAMTSTASSGVAPKSDIFGLTPTTTPDATPTRRHNHQKSRIFCDEDSDKPRGIAPGEASPRHIDTRARLFGDKEGNCITSRSQSSPRQNATWTSRLFEDNNEVPHSPKKTPKKAFERNPITGEVTYLLPITPESTSNGVGPMAKLPPGTFSEGVSC